MAADHKNFPAPVQRSALSRQKGRCASCGLYLSDIGQAGRTTHLFSEGAEGHHVIPHKLGGPISLENCVVLCRACHITAHQGGRWRDTSIYDDLRTLPMAMKIERIAALYPYYTG